MKKVFVLLLFVVPLLSRAHANDGPPGGEPEYYYTRLIYTGIGTPEGGGPNRMGINFVMYAMTH